MMCRESECKVIRELISEWAKIAVKTKSQEDIEIYLRLLELCNKLGC